MKKKIEKASTGVFARAFADVAEFHNVFASTPEPTEPTLQTPPKAMRRADWVQSEMDELLVAKTVAEQADAYIDAAYFCFGGLVEIGIGPSEGELAWIQQVYDLRLSREPGQQTPEQAMGYCDRIRAIMARLFISPTPFDQRAVYLSAIGECASGMASLGLDPTPLWAIVHKANMNKRQADGSVLRDAANGNKIVKPPHWVDPGPALDVEVRRQVRAAVEALPPEPTLVATAQAAAEPAAA